MILEGNMNSDRLLLQAVSMSGIKSAVKICKPVIHLSSSHDIEVFYCILAQKSLLIL